MNDELAMLDATAQADLVRRRKISPVELVDAAIARIEKLNPELNAVISTRFDKARAEAASTKLPDGPFKGVPFLLKDLDTWSAGDPYHCGMKVLRGVNWNEDRDTYLVEKYRAAGLVILGKTNVPELGLSVTTEPAAYGPTRNPWNPNHSSGGSSGGSAAAVASGMVPVAHAADGGGSIRIPASECGLVGLKPSRGRISLGPEAGEWWSGFVRCHVVSRTVRDTAAILDVSAGAMPGDPYFTPPPARPFLTDVGSEPGRLRVGFLATSPSGTLHPDCATAVRDTAKVLESLGHSVEESHPDAIDDRESTQHFMTIVTSWVAAELDDWRQRTGKKIGATDVEPGTWALAEMGRGVTASKFIETTWKLNAYTRRMAAWWAKGFDLLVTPTIGAPPPKLGELIAPPDNPLGTFETLLALIPFTPPFNITGQPAMSLPLHWNAGGLPIGVQVIGAYGREDLLIRVASQLEAAKPWSSRRPRIHA